MTDPTFIPFAGTDEELEGFLTEFALLAGADTVRHPRTRPGWSVLGGQPGSFNPNTVPWRLRVTRRPEGLAVESVTWALAWTRSKRARIAAYRAGQLADYLTSRLRGLGPERFDRTRLREPFAPYGESVADRTASFAWMAMTSLAAWVFALAASVILSWPLLARSIPATAMHSLAVEAAGALPLPSTKEARRTGALGAAIVLGLPIGFLAGLVHSAALAASEFGTRTRRLPQGSLLLLTIWIAWAFYPFLGGLAVPLAALVPAGAHLGATLVWGCRRERVRQGAPPRRALVAVGVLLAASLAGAIVPSQPEGNDFPRSLERIRDAWLLSGPLGRAVAAGFCRYAPYAAGPVTELYSADPGRPAREQMVAGCEDPAVAALLHSLHAVVVPGAANADVWIGPGGLPRPATLAALKEELDQFSRDRFRGHGLRDLCRVASRSLYYAGPLALLLLLMGAFAPLVSILFRKLRHNAAVFALSGTAMVTALVLVLAERPETETCGPAELTEALTDARAAHRYEAAFRAYGLDRPEPALTGALLKAADDPDLRVRLWACAALGRSGDARATAKLLEHLDDPDSFVRCRAAEGLGELGDPRATALLRQMMERRSWYEGRSALGALRRIAPESY